MLRSRASQKIMFKRIGEGRFGTPLKMQKRSGLGLIRMPGRACT
jgi:hypothetical protein